MKVIDLEQIGTWKDVRNACRTTIGLSGNDTEPTDEWKQKILMAEHSPIRLIKFRWKWVDIPYWVSVHLVRHGTLEHFVKTQRIDRTGVDRNELPQNAIVTHSCEGNLQALINLSRKRLCFQASKETREAVEELVNKIYEHDKVIGNALVKECVYRAGMCPEFKSCGYNKSEKYMGELTRYIS